MTLKLARIAACVLIVSQFSAVAETPCDSIDSVSRLVSSVRDIQADGYPKLAPLKIVALEETLSKVSLTPLLKRVEHSKLRLQYTTLELFVQSVDRAVDAYFDGALDIAGAQLHAAVPAQVGRSILELEKQLGCLPDSGVRAQFDRRVDGAAVGTRSVDAAGRLESTKAHARNAQSSKQELTALPELESGWHLMAIILGLFAAGTGYVVMRQERAESRGEERLICRQMLTFRIGRRDVDLVVVDITRGGMKIQHNGVIDKRQVILFMIGGRILKARIQWFNSIYAGAAFVHRLHEEEFRFFHTVQN